MFFKVLSHFKDNRKKLIIILVVIGLAIFFLKSINNNVSEKRSNSSSSNYTTAINKNGNQNDVLIISNTTTSNNTNNSHEVKFEESSVNTTDKAITAFMFYCNNKQIDDAYNMLTNDCKKLLYPTKDIFYKNYYQKNFSGAKDYEYTQYVKDENIYKITYTNDPLTTGIVDGNVISEYITVVNVDGTYKINISNLIKTEDLNIEKSNDYVNATVINKAIYVDYEIYTIKLKNKTMVNMILSEMKRNSQIYILDEDNDKFFIMNNEYTPEQVTIKYKDESTIELKFNRKYKTGNKKIKKLVFTDILLINRQYYDDSEAGNSINGNITYETKYTNYEPGFKFEIDI